MCVRQEHTEGTVCTFNFREKKQELTKGNISHKSKLSHIFIDNKVKTESG